MSCAPKGGGSTPLGNPQGLIDLVVHNGVNTDATRTDGRHALDQSISPNWTGVHTFQPGGHLQFYGHNPAHTLIAGAGGNAEQGALGAAWPSPFFIIPSFATDLFVGDSIRLVGFGRFAAGIGLTRLRVNYGPTIVYDTTSMLLNGDFRCEVYLVNQDNVNVVISVHLTSTSLFLPIAITSLQTPIGNNQLGIISGPVGNTDLQIVNGYGDYFRYR